MTESATTSKSVSIQGLPVLPLRDVVVYPHMVIPLFVGREKSIHALDVAMKADKRIMLIAQKQPDVDDPKGDDLYRIGTVASILQLLKLPDGTVKVLVEGVDGFLAPDEQRNDHVRVHHDIAQWQHRQSLDGHGLGSRGSGFRHAASLTRPGCREMQRRGWI